MKSLDEVRKAFEYCLTPERGCTGCPGHIDRKKPCYIWGEALFYLNEYATSLNNEPLTWGELQKMVGKPVWIECYPEGHKSSARWYVIREIGSKDRENLMYCHGAFNFTKDAQGKVWNAYLKERTHANEA